MKISTLELSVTELQQALREYVKKHSNARPGIVIVDNGYGKTVLHVPLSCGAVISGSEFQRQTEDEA